MKMPNKNIFVSSVPFTVNNIFNEIERFMDNTPTSLLEKRFFMPPELSQIALYCSICGRRHNNLRKNKTFIDEQRGVSIETGTKTIVSKTVLMIQSDSTVYPYGNLPLFLCQECSTIIVIAEIAYVKHCKSRKYRFNRKNEVIDDSFYPVYIDETKKVEHYTDYHDKLNWAKTASFLNLEMKAPSFEQFENEYLNKAGSSIRLR